MRRNKPSALGLSRKGKKVIHSNQRLLTITENERQMLLSERVLNILDSAKRSKHYEFPFDIDKIKHEDIPFRLKQYLIEECNLWSRAGTPCDSPEEEEELERRLLESNKSKCSIVEVIDLPLPPAKNAEEESERSPVKAEKSLLISNYFSTSQKSKRVFQKEVSSSSLPSWNSSSLTSTETTTQSTSSQSSQGFYSLFKRTSSQEAKRPRIEQPFENASLSILDFDIKPSKSGKVSPSSLSTSAANMPIKSKLSSFFGKGSALKKVITDKSDHLDLGSDLLRLFLENIDTDITVYGREEKPIKAHKVILKVRCPKLLGDVVNEESTIGKKREVVPLTCYSHMAVKCMMCYIYSGRISPPGFDSSKINEKDMEDLEQLGKKYNLRIPPPSLNTSNGTNSDSGNAKDVKDQAAQTDKPDVSESYSQTECPSPISLSTEKNREKCSSERFVEFEDDFCNLNNGFGSDNSGAASPDLFEEEERSFNDKTFQSLRSNREQRRSWPCTLTRFSPERDDDDCSIIILEDEVCNGSTPSRQPDNQNGDSKAETSTPCWKPDDADRSPALPMTSIWNKTADDVFFANLPDDEDLLNFPPTSPSAGKPYDCSPIHVPDFPTSRRISRTLIPTPSVPAQSQLEKKKSVPKRKAKKSLDNIVDEPEASQSSKKATKGASRKVTKKQQHDSEFDCNTENDYMPSSSQPSDVDMYRTPKAPQSQQCSRREADNNKTPMLNYSLIDTPILKVILAFVFLFFWALAHAVPVMVMLPYF